MKRRKRSDDEVTVHVTPSGGLRVDEKELLRSKAARETMAKMDDVLRNEFMEDGRNAERPRRS